MAVALRTPLAGPWVTVLAGGPVLASADDRTEPRNVLGATSTAPAHVRIEVTAPTRAAARIGGRRVTGDG